MLPIDLLGEKEKISEIGFHESPFLLLDRCSDYTTEQTAKVASESGTKIKKNPTGLIAYLLGGQLSI